jgi:PAS domain S-box-containing protein
VTDPNRHLFARSASLAVRNVVLDAGDELPRQREKLARIVLEEMYQFVALLDVEGTLLEVNHPALEGGGMTLDEIRGRPFWEARWWAVSRETQEHLQRAVRRAAAGEFVRYDVEIYGEDRGTGIIVIDFSLNPVRDREGRVVFLLPEGRNITEKKRAEAEIARKNQELQRLLDKVRELDELKSRFFANVSHELRTPLALVLGPTERMLAEGDNLTEQQRRDLEVVRRNAAMLLKHVNDLLDLSKLDAGKMSARYAEVDLARLVRTIASHFDALAPQRDLAWAVEAPERLVAEVDPDKIERIVLNLLSNAFKFTPPGGRIQCALAATEDGRAVLSVQDSGPGVPPDQRSAIFERFRQVDGGSTRQFGGTGLGLSIARDFVDLHGGTIGATDAPGGGALFLVEIPLRAPEGEHVRREVEPSAPAAAPALHGILEELRPVAARVEAVAGRAVGPLALVVEDNPEMRRFIAESLAGDLRVEVAADGEEGLAKALAIDPDVIVTDVMMPRMSGDQMLREIRRRPELDGVPALVLSAKADDRLRIRLLREGAQDYVVKPFSAEEVAARAVNLATMKRARDVLQRELASHDDDLAILAGELVRKKREVDSALDAMRVARDQAARASDVKSAFLSMVSHELRTPLQSIVLQLDRLERSPDSTLTEAQRVRTARIGASTTRIVALVDALLEYARVESGRLSLRVEPFDVAALAADVVEELLPSAEQKRIALRLSAAPDLPPLTSDARLVRLVLSNLLENAVKYTEHGHVEVAVEADGAELRLAVADTGPGIADADRARIFEPFTQLEPVAQKHARGVGLGLALVTQLLDALGGGLTLQSVVGEGSTFTATLPLWRPAG